MVLGSVLAVLTALVWSVSMVSIRRGLDRSNFLSVTIVVTLIGNLLFWPLAFLLSRSSFNVLGASIFVLAGLLTPGLVRLIYFKGMEEVGVSMNASIFAMYPLFSTFFSIILLGEHPTILMLLGVACTVFGAVMIERGTHRNKAKGTWKKLLLPFSAAIVNGAVYVIKKIGLTLYDEPVMGVALGYLAALSLYAVLLRSSSSIRNRISIDKRNFSLFWKGGLGMSIGWLLSFYAIRYGDVMAVVPLIQCEPLFIFLLTYFYLKGVETVSIKQIIGVISIILGVILVALV